MDINLGDSQIYVLCVLCIVWDKRANEVHSAAGYGE